MCGWLVGALKKIAITRTGAVVITALLLEMRHLFAGRACRPPKHIFLLELRPLLRPGSPVGALVVFSAPSCTWDEPVASPALDRNQRLRTYKSVLPLWVQLISNRQMHFIRRHFGSSLNSSAVVVFGMTSGIVQHCSLTDRLVFHEANTSCFLKWAEDASEDDLEEAF